jgi:hypothetical protein
MESCYHEECIAITRENVYQTLRTVHHRPPVSAFSRRLAIQQMCSDDIHAVTAVGTTPYADEMHMKHLALICCLGRTSFEELLYNPIGVQ